MEALESNSKKIFQLIETIKVKYGQYLSVFYYFDPNSLGTISEILLTALLNEISNVTAHHTANRGLTDLIINDINISLKTSSKKYPIGLGSDELYVPKGSVKLSSLKLLKLFPDKSVPKIPIISLMKQYKKTEYYYSFVEIQKRIKSIAFKLSGINDNHIFIWIEKNYDNGKLKNINIHISDFNSDEVYDILMNSYLYLTDNAWGIKDDLNNILVKADNSGKALNISPEFILTTSDDNIITINLADYQEQNYSLEFLKKEITKKFFSSLNKIHTDIFG